jgi:NAD(P)-dependent dehydrogenase (short-subunit alcohol dehydrogenase family)
MRAPQPAALERRPQMRTLHGKVVLVTGAARGIGEHTARLAAERGARVALVGLEPERLASLAAELEAAHGGRTASPVAIWSPADVTSTPELEAAAASAVEQLGGIDVVVANAGIAGRGTVATANIEAMAKVVEVNLIGVMRTVHATLPHMIARRGHYLLISSASSFLVMPGMIDYAASKAAVEHFGTGLRLELAHTGATVGTAHPIWIDTDMVRDARADLPVFDTSLRQMPGPLGRTISVGDCARALVGGIERRKRKVHIPRSMVVFSALRTVLNGPLGDRLVRGSVDVRAMEEQVRALGRSYGRTAAVAPVDAPSDAVPGADREPRAS